MKGIIFVFFVQLSIPYFTSVVESLAGPKVMEVGDREFLFVASLQYFPEGRHFCTGSLITKRHVLTAAHCLQGNSTGRIQIAIGVNNLQSNTTKYNVSSWIKFHSWANGLGIRIEPAVIHDIAIVTLRPNESEPIVPPARLSKLNKEQFIGKTATLIGWKTIATAKLLHKATVKILSDLQCESKIHLITDYFPTFSSKTFCSVAEPYALLKCGDSGGPILDGWKNLLGVNFGDCPDPQYARGNFPDDFLQKYLVNLHFGVDYYRYFIVNVTGYH